MTAFGVISSGFRIKTYDEILESLMQTARETFGYDMDLSANTILGQELRSIAVEITEVWQQLEGAYYSGFISSAEGQNLDRVVALIGIKRREATSATGTVTFSVNDAASADIIIPKGTVVGTEDESILFETSEEGTLPDEGTSVDIPVIAKVKGSAGNVSGASITHLIDLISGIDSITNESALNGGGDAEKDSELRIRAMTMKPAAKGTVAALASALLALDGVVDVNIVEDTTAHTITIAVAGGVSDEITATIEETRPCGIAVTWDYAAGLEIDVTVNVVGATGVTETEVQTQVSEAISGWLSGKEIGEDLVYYDLLLVIAGCITVTNISSLSITDGINTADAIGETIEVDEDKRAEPHTTTVNVS